MANYTKIIELRPEVADFIRVRNMTRFRGEVMAYARNVSCSSFSTDGSGFRHSSFQGEDLTVAACLASKRYGLVLGASNNFGFGIAGNENTTASLLAARFGFPFANVAMPGANSRNLHAALIGILARTKAPPAVVVHSSGGDLGSFCQSSLVDPIFGPPNRAQLKGAVKERSLRTDAERNLPRFLAFTSLWTSVIRNLCRAYKIPMVQIHQSTFFEKSKPNATEVEFGLGKPFRESEEREFANFRKINPPFYARRKAVAEKFGIPLAGWGLSDQLSFLDEFHLDREGTRLLTDAVGDTIEPLL
jgi:hypothetical protein